TPRRRSAGNSWFRPRTCPAHTAPRISEARSSAGEARPFGPSILGGRLEAQHLLPEPASAQRADDHSDDHPACTDDLRGIAQVDPEEQTGDESGGGRPEVAKFSRGAADVIACQGGGVDAHVGEQRAEIQYLGAEPVGDQKRAAERDETDEDDVVAWSAVLRVDGAKEGRRQGIAAAHAVKESRRTQMRAYARADA